MQGAPCAGGAAPPQNGSNAVAEPLSGVQAEPYGSPKLMKNTLLFLRREENRR